MFITAWYRENNKIIISKYSLVVFNLFVKHRYAPIYKIHFPHLKLYVSRNIRHTCETVPPSAKNTLLHQFAASLYLNQRRTGFYYFLALLLFFSFTCYEEYNPKWIGGPRMKVFSSDFLTNEFRQTPDSERSMRRNLNTQPTLNDGVNSVWAQQMDFKHQIFFCKLILCQLCVESFWSQM